MTQERILLCRILRLRRVAQATSSIPPQCDPRGAFLCHRKAISYDMKNVCFRGKQTLLGIMQGCKTLHGSFHLFIMSRFPGSQIIVRLLLLIPYGTMETFEAYSLLTVTGSLRTCTWFPLSPADFLWRCTHHVSMEFYTTHLYHIVIKLSRMRLTYYTATGNRRRLCRSVFSNDFLCTGFLIFLTADFANFLFSATGFRGSLL